MWIEWDQYTPWTPPWDQRYFFKKWPVNSQVVQALEWRSHIINAKQKVNSLSGTKDDALRLVEICEILRGKCIDTWLDYIPSYVSEGNKSTWLKWDMYTLAPWNTTSMKQIEVWWEKRRVSKVFIRKIPSYQRFANYMIDLLDKEWIEDFWF